MSNIKSACPYLVQVQSIYTLSVATVTILYITLICYRNEPTETPILTWWQEEQKKASPDCP